MAIHDLWVIIETGASGSNNSKMSVELQIGDTPIDIELPLGQAGLELGGTVTRRFSASQLDKVNEAMLTPANLEIQMRVENNDAWLPRSVWIISRATAGANPVLNVSIGEWPPHVFSSDPTDGEAGIPARTNWRLDLT